MHLGYCGHCKRIRHDTTPPIAWYHHKHSWLESIQTRHTVEEFNKNIHCIYVLMCRKSASNAIKCDFSEGDGDRIGGGAAAPDWTPNEPEQRKHSHTKCTNHNNSTSIT
eukprot:98439_1